MSGVEWKEPPVEARVPGSRRWTADELITQLRANPGKWALWPRQLQSPSYGYTLKKKYPDLEVRTNQVDSGRYEMYLRAVAAAGAGVPREPVVLEFIEEGDVAAEDERLKF